MIFFFFYLEPVSELVTPPEKKEADTVQAEKPHVPEQVRAKRAQVRKIQLKETAMKEQLRDLERVRKDWAGSGAIGAGVQGHGGELAADAEADGWGDQRGFWVEKNESKNESILFSLVNYEYMYIIVLL